MQKRINKNRIHSFRLFQIHIRLWAVHIYAMNTPTRIETFGSCKKAMTFINEIESAELN